MDAFSDPGIEQVVVMSSSQVGKTEILLNVVGYYIDKDPSPIMVLQPTLEIAQAWSKDRLSPMLRDTPCLKGTVKDPRSRDSGNTLLHKTFKGGHITMAGANSPASLASRPIRVVLCDEVDRYSASAGSEGDPIELIFKRTTTFWNRKLGLFSTPLIKGTSRIEAAYEESDKRKYHVPCIYCGAYQVLVWAQVKWPDGEPAKASYFCRHCDGEMTDGDKIQMLQHGEWRAEAVSNGIAGFWFNEIYSPWITFGKMATKFVQAKRSRNPERLKIFVNTSLAEVWEGETGETIDPASLMSRCEQYGTEIPKDAAILTCGVDVQENRFELEVIAYGRGEESWGIEYVILPGDPTRAEIWRDLDTFLQKTYKHESGTTLRIFAVCIDTGGHHTQQTYNFIRPREVRRIYGVKGANRYGEPIISRRPSRKNTGGVNLFMVGSDSAKDLLYGRLKITEPGPGYMHFPKGYSGDYFNQLTAEHAIFEKGVRKWVKKTSGARNEALDARIYSLAALELLKFSPRFNLDRLVDILKARAEQGQNEDKEKPDIKSEPAQKINCGRRIISKGYTDPYRR